MIDNALSIVYQDDDILAVDKPAGRLVIPGRGEPRGEALNQVLEARLGQKIFVVHRIDRDASGLVLFAKNAAAHRELSLQFENRQTQKNYLVAVEGSIEQGGEIRAPLKSFGSGRVGTAPEGKPSVTSYEVLEVLNGAALLRVRIETGRRHQIRAHFYSIGHPVLGDRLYGKTRPVGGAPRLMLHAHQLIFRKRGGAELALTADLPADFKAVIDTLRSAR